MNKLTIAGFVTCGAFAKAKQVLTGLSVLFPHKFDVTVQEYPTRDEYMSWLQTFNATVGAPEHKTSPIVWFENGKYLGGRDDTVAWARGLLSAGEVAQSLPTNDDGFNSQHSYDYDLVVIGGGSGGLACSKEASRLGAKVAVLDYVQPSPAGSKWGLGGTCVNVGCIPKKLMHTAALLGESAKDAKAYGWEGVTDIKHNWETMRTNVQDHIKGLNFGYRVQLREKGVTYFNKKGRFLGPHELECTDAKGKTSTITAARFVLAVGGRPTPLSCPGGEYAISSDDIFMKETAPGKTCVVGAGYVALECAGFINGLHQGEVVVLVRSMPLRGFDRDCVGYIQKFMEESGVRIVQGVVPKSIEKLPSGKLLVSYGDVQEEFDTVLAAVGRKPELPKLNLESVDPKGILTSEKTGKVIGVNEQTSVPHIYAIGDILDGRPELTPVAILAGKLLARRLFSDSTTPMDYRNIATTVFTPLEFGTVGFSEDDAIAEFGAENIECYVSELSPLEWTISDEREKAKCYAKVVVLKPEKEKVLGMHIVAPNAGEIIQGYALAVKKGIVYQDLSELVGIHPTTAEEFTTMTITKSSGVTIAKTGC